MRKTYLNRHERCFFKLYHKSSLILNQCPAFCEASFVIINLPLLFNEIADGFTNPSPFMHWKYLFWTDSGYELLFHVIFFEKLRYNCRRNVQISCYCLLWHDSNPKISGLEFSGTQFNFIISLQKFTQGILYYIICCIENYSKI